VSHPLLKPVAWLALQLLLLALGLMSLCWNAVALLAWPLLPRERGKRIGRAGISFGYAAFWWLARRSGLLRMDASALDALATERGLIVAANHPSLLDALMLVARLPRSVCIMKASLMRNPFLGPGARLAGYVHGESGAAIVRLAVRELRDGGQIVMFPEGTRSTRRPMNPLRPGFTTIAKLAPAPVQTVFIETASPYLGKHWPLWRLPPLPIEFRVRLGRRFAPQDDALALLHEIEAYFSARLSATATPP